MTISDSNQNSTWAVIMRSATWSCENVSGMYYSATVVSSTHFHIVHRSKTDTKRMQNIVYSCLDFFITIIFWVIKQYPSPKDSLRAIEYGDRTINCPYESRFLMDPPIQMENFQSSSVKYLHVIRSPHCHQSATRSPSNSLFRNKQSAVLRHGGYTLGDQKPVGYLYRNW